MTQPVELTNVCFAYRPDRPNVLSDVTFAVRSGEFLGVLGPNGAGKSTLLRLMAGLARPTTGNVYISGRDCGTMPRQQIARLIALVPQSEPTVFGFTCRDVVAMGRAPHTGLLGALSSEDHAAIDAALMRCDAEPLATRPLAELSGGEQKRVLIARALAQRAPIMLLVEACPCDAIRMDTGLHMTALDNRASFIYDKKKLMEIPGQDGSFKTANPRHEPGDPTHPGITRLRKHH